MSEPVKLNVGGGDKLGREKGYVNVDLRKLPKTELMATVLSLPYRSNTVDEVVASDVLEHVPIHQFVSVLWEIQRVLKIGGVLKIKMPDLRALAQAYVEGKMDVGEFGRRIYGNQEGNDPANFHKSGTDSASLHMTLKLLGFGEIKVATLDGNDFGNMGARAVKYGLGKEARR